MADPTGVVKKLGSFPPGSGTGTDVLPVDAFCELVNVAFLPRSLRPMQRGQKQRTGGGFMAPPCENTQQWVFFLSATHRFLLLVGYPQQEKERHCDFFMWCDEVQNFVQTTPSCCFGKDERIKNLETEVALLEKELRRHKALLKKTRKVAQSLPKLFSFLKETDDEDGSDGESSASMSVCLGALHCGLRLGLGWR
ncbi:hypothetical protein Taro_007761, partial [Colocasia esculenta]|nr:hypothetical protein [Colocasia esculenta]